ncbi:sensor histidine kinase [Lactovum odontotermitis]
MKNTKKSILLVTFLTAVLLAVSIFMLRENALRADTTRINSELDKVILTDAPDKAAGTSVRQLSRNTQSDATNAIKNGASYSRQVKNSQLTITKAYYENGQILGFLALTEERTSASGSIQLMIVVVVIFYVVLLALILKGRKVDGGAPQEPAIVPQTETEKPYEFTEFFNFPIFIYDNYGKIRYGNGAFEREFPGHSEISQFSGQLDFLNFLLGKMLNPSPAEALIHFEALNQDFETQFLPMSENNNFLVTLRDVTAYRNALQAQKELIANVSHELKTPIASIHGLAELLGTHPELTEEKKQEFVRLIAAESDRLLELVTDILLLSQTPAGQVSKTEVNLKRLLEQTLAQFQREIERKKLDIETSFDEISFMSNEKKLRAIFKNLIENAVFYSNLNGKVVLRLHQNKDTINFSITNTGQGLSEVEKNRIFERFYRAESAGRMNPKGTGLGLAIVQKNLLELGGKISVESVGGLETSFQVTFTR